MEENLPQAQGAEPSKDIYSIVVFVVIILAGVIVVFSPIGLIMLSMFSELLKLATGIVTGRLGMESFLSYLPLILNLAIVFLWLFAISRYKSKLIIWSLPILFFCYSLISVYF
jgi:hypothetical protein